MGEEHKLLPTLLYLNKLRPRVGILLLYAQVQVPLEPIVEALLNLVYEFLLRTKKVIKV